MLCGLTFFIHTLSPLWCNKTIIIMHLLVPPSPSLSLSLLLTMMKTMAYPVDDASVSVSNITNSFAKDSTIQFNATMKCNETITTLSTSPILSHFVEPLFYSTPTEICSDISATVLSSQTIVDAGCNQHIDDQESEGWQHRGI
jgi:hypothetical protein